MNTNAVSILPQTPDRVKSVAIYCRVSTENQGNEGTSLDTQRAACLKYCQKHSHKVTHQFIETASGLTLERPKLDELRQLIRTEDIGGLVIYCLDRISRNPTHGVILTQEMEKHKVTLEAVTEDIDNSELGKLITYIRQYAANLEAEKIRERTGRGIRSRVFDKKMPVTFRTPYGYEWDRENVRLVPNDDYSTVELIFKFANNGKSYDFIIAELKRQGIPSPAGLLEWNKNTISTILRNPIYAGQYYAFKSEAVKPVKQNDKCYGKVKSSVKRLPQDQWHYIPEIEVKNPPITLDQRALLLDQLKKRQKQASRNAQREYLLRGMIYCETHKGKKGEPRVYHGQPHRKGWRYTCPVGGCDSPHLDGEAIEYIVKNSIIGPLFGARDQDFYAQLTDKANRGKLENSLKTELHKFEKETEKVLNNQAKLEDERISGKFIDQDVYERLYLKYQVRRQQIKERQDVILGQIAQLGREQLALESWRDIKARLLGKLGFEPQTWWDRQDAGDINKAIDKLTYEEWRELLSVINLEIHVFPNFTIHDREDMYYNMDLTGCKMDQKIKENPRLLVKYAKQLAKPHKTVNVVVKYALPIKPEMVNDIVSHVPENDLPNLSYYPIHFKLDDLKIGETGNTGG